MLDHQEPDARQRQMGRLRWRCRRGMKELDVLLERYLEQCLVAAEASEREAFEGLLEYQDPELMAFFTGRAQPQDPALSQVVERIRGFA